MLLLHSQCSAQLLSAQLLSAQFLLPRLPCQLWLLLPQVFIIQVFRNLAEPDARRTVAPEILQRPQRPVESLLRELFRKILRACQSAKIAEHVRIMLFEQGLKIIQAHSSFLRVIPIRMPGYFARTFIRCTAGENITKKYQGQVKRSLSLFNLLLPKIIAGDDPAAGRIPLRPVRSCPYGLQSKRVRRNRCSSEA